MVRLIKKYEDKKYRTEAKQVGTLYHVCTLDALVDYIIPENQLSASGKYWNSLLNTNNAVSFTRDALFVVPTWTVYGSPILFQFVIDGDKLSDRYKITPFNGNGVNPRALEKEEVVIGPIKNFKSYIKEVRFDIKSLFFYNTYKIIKYLKEVQEYLGPIPCRRKHLPFLQKDLSIDYKKTLREDELYKIKTLDELITLIKDSENLDVKDYIDSKELFGKYFADLSENQVITILNNHPEWINIKDKNGDTPLSNACFSNNTKLAKFLIEHDVDVNIKDKKGNTPLYWACYYKNTELAKLLLEHGADINIKDEDGYTPLYTACLNRNIELVELLIEHGADVNSKNKNGYTPLSWTCAGNNIEIAKLLIEHGADVNFKDEDGNTPLYWACIRDSTELVKLLLEHGAGKDFNVNNLPNYITKNKQIEELVLSYLNKNKKTESVRVRRLYRRYL